MKTALLSIFAPAVAIFAGALLQQTLVWSWPGAQTYALGHLSVESYVGPVVIVLLSFWLGKEIRRRAPASRAPLLLFVVPVIWLLTNLLNKFSPGFGAGMLSVIYLFCAVAPLIGTALALALPSNPRLERPLS